MTPTHLAAVIALASSRTTKQWEDLYGDVPPTHEVLLPCKPETCDECTRQYSAAQHAEDRRLLPWLLRATHGRPGTFIELGALDGLRLSNTLLLEKCHGWSGLLIEANRASFSELVRSGRNRSRFAHSAVCEGGRGANATVAFARFGGAEAAQREFTTRAQRHSKLHGFEMVPCNSLSELMQRHGLGDGVTLLSLDTEGAEEIVLRSARPLSRFAVVLVEASDVHREKDAAVRALLYEDGLRPLMKLRLRQAQNVSMCASGGCSDVFVQPALLAAHGFNS